MLKRICLLLACILALCGVACAQEAAMFTPEDFLGEWELSIVVSEGMHMNMQAWGFIALMRFEEDGSALLRYPDESFAEMSWRIDEAGRAWLGGYNPEAEVEMGFAEDGSLFFGDEIGQMYFLPAAQSAA